MSKLFKFFNHPYFSSVNMDNELFAESLGRLELSNAKYQVQMGSKELFDYLSESFLSF